MTPERIKELQEYASMNCLGHSAIKECLNEIERLRHCLEFYADEDNWAPNYMQITGHPSRYAQRYLNPSLNW